MSTLEVVIRGKTETIHSAALLVSEPYGSHRLVKESGLEGNPAGDHGSDMQ